MKNIFKCTNRNIHWKATMILLMFLITINIMAQEFEENPSWIEEFNVLDGKDWNTSTNIKGGKCFSYFDKKYVFVKNGRLILKADIAKDDNGKNYYRQAYVNTYKKHSFEYGKLEIRAKAPTGKGVWPAIWLVNEDRNNYPRGEIDIFEYVDWWNGKQFQGNIHYVEDSIKRRQFAQYASCDVSKFHIYTLEWTKDRIELKLDGDRTYLVYTKSHPNGWVFNKPYYLIINVEFGRGWGATKGIDDSALPCQMEVDWIKYYKLKD